MPHPDEVMDTHAETNAESARAFLVSRGFVPTVLKDGSELSVVLTSRTTGNTVAERYGRGATERDALVSAAQRYRVEQADWDQSGIRIALEYMPTITATAAAQHAVTQRFEREGLLVEAYERSQIQLQAERNDPGGNWAPARLNVHIESRLPADEVIQRVGTPVTLESRGDVAGAGRQWKLAAKSVLKREMVNGLERAV